VLNFPVIAHRYLLPSTASYEARACPDQYVGLKSEIETGGHFGHRVPASERPHRLACVLLVLESPHTSEFGTEPGPAKGRTGANIVRFLREVPGLHDTERFGLVLVNAIQFQCSLGRPTSEVRDTVFRKAWDNGGRTDFESRLRALYRVGDYVVNCCTRGQSEKIHLPLRALVQRAMASVLPENTVVLRRNHPSSWHFRANRTREWQYAV